MYGIKKRHFITIALLLLPLLTVVLPGAVTQQARLQAVRFLKFPLTKLNTLSIKLQDAISPKGFFLHQLKNRDSQIQILRAENSQMKEIFLHDERLQKLLPFKQAAAFKTMHADIVARDPGNWRHSIIINKGTSGGIAKNMFVVSGQGLAGRISQAGRKVSKAILLTDPDFKVAAVCQRSREQMIVLGNGRNLCALKYLPQDADLQKGDVIVTSGLGGFCPKGILIGDVLSVRKSKDGFTTEAYLAPSARLNRMESALVLIEGR